MSDDRPPFQHRDPHGPPCVVARSFASSEAETFTITYCDGTTEVRPRAEWGYDRIAYCDGSVVLRRWP